MSTSSSLKGPSRHIAAPFQQHQPINNQQQPLKNVNNNSNNKDSNSKKVTSVREVDVKPSASVPSSSQGNYTINSNSHINSKSNSNSNSYNGNSNSNSNSDSSVSIAGSPIRRQSSLPSPSSSSPYQYIISDGASDFGRGGGGGGNGVDYHTFNFPPLDTPQQTSFEKYCGPTPESNWVIPQTLLVGAYPASQDDNETFDLLTSILKHRVTKFVCLQEEYRTHGVSESMWRNGQALRPYFLDVQALVANRASIPEFAGFDIVHPSHLSFIHFPIRDCGVTDDGRVLELARTLVNAISEGEVIYLHCWGGHGRTGTLVCIMLHLMYGLNPVEAMARCQLVHDLRQCPVVVGSPQTQTQRDQVTRVIRRLSAQPQFYKRTLSDSANMSESGDSRHNQQQQQQQHHQQSGSPRSAEAAEYMHAHAGEHPAKGMHPTTISPPSSTLHPFPSSPSSSPSSPIFATTPHTPSSTWASVISNSNNNSQNNSPAAPFQTPASNSKQNTSSSSSSNASAEHHQHQAGGRERTAMSIDVGILDTDQEDSISYMISGEIEGGEEQEGEGSLNVGKDIQCAEEEEGEYDESIREASCTSSNMPIPLKPDTEKPSDGSYGFRMRWGTTNPTVTM